MADTDRTWQDDAREFGLHVKQGDWRLGLLVARNIEKGKGNGVRKDRSLSDRKGLKVSAAEFARAAGTTAQRVLRYFEAWEKAADAGHVAHAVELVPGAEANIKAEKLPPWSDFYDASDTGGRPRDSIKKTIADPQTRPKVVAQIAEAMEDPEVAQEIAAQASRKALGNVDIAASTETYLRRKRDKAAHEPPEDAASRKLGGIGPSALADQLHKETMEPRLDRIIAAFDFAELHWKQYGFRLALTDVDEFDELDRRLARVGELYAAMMDLYDAAKAAKIANEAEGARQ